MTKGLDDLDDAQLLELLADTVLELGRVERLRNRLVVIATGRTSISNRMVRDIGHVSDTTIYRLAREARGGEPLMRTSIGNETRAARAKRLSGLE